ncbi:MAG: hypothetical protein HZC29_03945 [Thaumarchaeota archaeon]|nr:hypothetical protein [Nitrososphaerota archaeon]
MKKRHTIVMDSELEKKIRKVQVDRITKTGRSVSFSSVISDLLEKSLD